MNYLIFIYGDTGFENEIRREFGTESDLEDLVFGLVAVFGYPVRAKILRAGHSEPEPYVVRRQANRFLYPSAKTSLPRDKDV